MTRPKISHYLKIAVSLALILLVISNIDWRQALVTFKTGKPIFLICSILLIILGRFLMFYRWYVLFLINRMASTFFWQLFLINTIAYFWGLILPSGVGPDVVKAYYSSKDFTNTTLCVSSIVVDRIIGLFSLIFIAIVTIGLFGHLLDMSYLNIYIITAFSCFVIVFFIAMREDVFQFLQQNASRLVNNKLLAKLFGLYSTLVSYKSHPKILLVSFGVSLVIQIIRILIIWIISLAFAIDVPFVYLAIIVPIMYVFTMIPISFANIGVREVTIITFFSTIDAGCDIGSCRGPPFKR